MGFRKQRDSSRFLKGRTGGELLPSGQGKICPKVEKGTAENK
jgi:hypothetical protein